MNDNKKTIVTDIRVLKDGDVTATIWLKGFPPTTISAVAADLQTRSRSATGRSIGQQLGHAIIQAFMPEEEENG